MCGIFCLISQCQDECQLLKHYEPFKESIERRGPNSQGTAYHEYCNHGILLASSILWLQGSTITNQPIKTPKSLFVYNGDIFDGAASDEIRALEGDTKLFLQTLEAGLENPTKALENLQGPYAFIHVNLEGNRITFGRDVYGRRSLLLGKCNDQIILTSVARKNTEFNFIELPSIGIFSIDLESGNVHIYPWKCRNRNFSGKLTELELFLNRPVDIVYRQNEAISCDIADSGPRLIKSTKDIFYMLLNNTEWLKNITSLNKLLEQAVKKRISTQPRFCGDCILERVECCHALTGVLFSGGVDCAILALLADKFTENSRPIDLINVAFDRVKDYSTPDRLTGVETFRELQGLCPDRQWNFVSVNVENEELVRERNERIADLIYSLKTILDDSLGCAIWFASRAKTEDYTSPSRVLLVGMGADELFGGYTRHRAALQKQGWKGLAETLDEDWQNISHRNLARDDRVVSDHGRQLRTPYLDEDLVEFVRSLKPWEKTHPSNDFPHGIGEKLLLRCLAYHLGLKKAATLKKRALQFGSRIANPKENAHDVSPRL